MERSTHPGLRKHSIDDPDRRFEELVERSEKLSRKSATISSHLSSPITASDTLISGCELSRAKGQDDLQEIEHMPHDQEIEEKNPQNEELERQIDETRLALENAERFRDMLSPDNSRGHEFILRCLVELETRLASLSKKDKFISSS